jgi:small-conductance mechanosensitive channel
MIGEHDYEIRLERIKPRGKPPVWVFSRRAVAHIPALYREFSPGRIENAMPEFLKRRELFHIALWQWLGFLIILLAGAGLGWLVQFVLNRILRRFDSTWSRAAAQAIRGPGAVAVGVWIVYVLIKEYLALAGPILSRLEPILFAGIAVGLIWFVQRLIHVLSVLISHRYEAYGNDEGNVLLTRISMVRHVLTFTVFVGGVVLALGRFQWFRNIGMSLLASAGIAGLILGIAAHRMLGNLFAGLLLAVTQPVKTGDAILFEGEFGWIEEIAITYIVIRSWDLRRLVVPTAYFLDHPFENWSRGSQQLIKPVILHADYRVDVVALREALGGILEETDLWDRDVPAVLQVVDCHPGTVELRALCSARDPGSAWNLQCHVRERLLTTLRDLEDGRYLPRERVMLVNGGNPSRDRRPRADQDDSSTQFAAAVPDREDS